MFKSSRDELVFAQCGDPEVNEGIAQYGRLLQRARAPQPEIGAVIRPVLGVCQRCEVELYCVANPASLPTYVDGCRPSRCAGRATESSQP